MRKREWIGEKNFSVSAIPGRFADEGKKRWSVNEAWGHDSQ
jgi:hypothetical protein